MFSEVLNLALDAVLFALLISEVFFYNTALGMLDFPKVVGDPLLLFIISRMVEEAPLVKRSVDIAWPCGLCILFALYTFVRHNGISSGESVLDVLVLVLEKSLPDFLNFSVVLLLFFPGDLFFHLDN